MKCAEQDIYFFFTGQDSSETYFFDAFRQFHPERKEAFTCWNSEKNCRSTNFGTRLDYILTSNDLRGHLVTCDIHPDIQGSDHCPVSAQLAFLGKNSAKLPALCTKVIYYGELTTNPLEYKEFNFVYICSSLSNTTFIRKIRKQNGSKLQFLT